MKYKFIHLSSLIFFGSFICLSQSSTPYIVVDQFGYRADTPEKIAVIRNPVTGFDASESFTPGTEYALIDVSTSNPVFTGTLTAWNNGEEDPSSGDQTWWFDFSSVKEVGEYYVLDVTNNVKSFNFEIRNDIYNDVLKHAVRSFYYQRVGYAKEAPFAETGWIDGASHIGPLQDKECRPYDDPTNASKEKDLSGGWYDAGDYNKYTPWTANYVYEMVQAYNERPLAWADDYNIPESGNGIADILDEAKWGMDHLLKLQNPDGSMISVVDESEASPPSSATGQSLYGGVNTTSTLAAAGAFAYGAKVYRSIGLEDYADSLEAAAKKAWEWADANPAVIWRNNDEAFNSKGIGAGQQETNDYGRLAFKMRAAVHLYEITNESTYKDFFETNYTDIHLMAWTFAYPFEVQEQETLLYYTQLEGISATVKSAILAKYRTAMGKANNLPDLINETDPYLSHLKDYVWGSNGTKAQKGLMFYAIKHYNTSPTDSTDGVRGAERYVHYLHGTNPLNLAYLTNMGNYGAENSASTIYHNWFSDGSSLWDEVGESTYGPAPGFVPGGPNPSYSVDNCCSSSCGGAANTAKCTSMNLTPPLGQPAQKSYKQFNTGWPVNSWSVTENSGGYQMRYIRLLSKFVDELDAPLSVVNKISVESLLEVFPNPAKEFVTVNNKTNKTQKLEIATVNGITVKKQSVKKGINKINIKDLRRGIYLIKMGEISTKLIVE